MFPYLTIFFFSFFSPDTIATETGGAMYITCGESNGVLMEPETGYVPNNPLFGLPLDSPQVSFEV